MSHILKFSAVFLLIAVLLFAFFCLEVSLDEGFSLTHRVCATHGRLRIRITLPYGVADAGAVTGALVMALPKQIVTPVGYLGEKLWGLFSLLHEAVLKEAEGCTAFSE